MNQSIRCRFAVVLVILLAGSAVGWQLKPQPTEHQRGLLWADLWVQTSAEYVACCLQTYQLAGDQIERDAERWEETQSRLAPEFRKLPPCVVMDLDETVLDNGSYQTFLYDTGKDHSTDLFSEFVSKNHKSIRLVPGAGDFIRRAETLGLTVIYLTNRPEALREATIETLAQWGVNTEGLKPADSVRLLMKRNDSNKTPRRNLVREQYTIVALFGDQLTDFAEEFAYERDASPESLRAAVREYRRLWGKQWFILPNPVYGDWQLILKGEPADHLRRAGK
jgi:5'-nucleotidase (lipoprotein e(P4) family)